MLGSMQKHPLLIKDLIAFAAREHGDREMVTLTHGGEVRSNYRRVEARARRLSSALEMEGIDRGDRIGTLMTNSQWHFELYYGAACMGAVCHTINPRLFDDQLGYIINHAGDRLLFVDAEFVPLVERLAPLIRATVEAIVVVGEDMSSGLETLRRDFAVHRYEPLIERGDPTYQWPELDEGCPSSLCYTSGTTGDPKGVLYSHRSTVIHAYAANLKDAFNLGAMDVVLPLVPMFHANCWAFPYLAAMVGAKLVFSQRSLMDGASITDLMIKEGVTFGCGVPTIWSALLRHLEATGQTVPTVTRLQAGGAACPFPIIKSFHDQYGIRVIHGWGMTELSPIGTINQPKPEMAQWSSEQRLGNQRKQGRGLCGVEMKLLDDAGGAVPRDGATSGRLMVKGHWVVDTYLGMDRSALEDGWFDTGDIATIDPLGFMEIVDRAKDIIKSGGEWISSVALEQLALDLAGVEEAAAIPVPHLRWDERPLLLIVRGPGSAPTRDEILTHLAASVAKWWLPDDIVFVDSLPRTNTGKVIKTELRAQYRDHLLKGPAATDG